MEPFEKKGMPQKGPAHVWAALKYSIDGFKVLLEEEATKLEFGLLFVALVCFAIAGAGLNSYLVLIGLFIAILAVEAINTAIELIVDKTSPEISDYAKQAKDLGSFACMCTQLCFGGYGLYVVFIG